MPNLKAGDLNHYITILRINSVQDEATGIVTEVPTIFAKVWASVRPASAREFMAADAAQSKVITVIRIRYLHGIQSSMRILHGTHTYNIEGFFEDPESGAEWLTLPVTEVLPEIEPQS